MPGSVLNTREKGNPGASRAVGTSDGADMYLVPSSDNWNTGSWGRLHVTGGYQHLRKSGIGAVGGFLPDVAAAGALIGSANDCRRIGRVKPHQGVQLVLQDNHHVDPPEKLP